MTVEALVDTLEQSGVRLIIDGERLKLEAYPDRVPGEDAIAGLRQNKSAVIEYLRRRACATGFQFSSFPTPICRKTEKLEDRPETSIETERRFPGQPHARLFPFIGRKVRTPGGPGTLIQVFADRATVILDSEMTKCAAFTPGEIEPVSWELSS